MSDTILSAEAHFEALRQAVWLRFSARHRGCTRDAFEEAYAEWWTREVERAAAGRPSRAEAPTAFVAEAVHRVLIDDLRARARGLGRGEKASLEIVELDAELDAAGAEETASQAGYEALAHRILTLVRGQLTERELKVFVWSYLYLQSTDRTATALGLSHPRVKKDRKRIATKVGRKVWDVLSGELELCAAYDDKRLLAVFEILTVHVEDCPVCRAALGGVRRGALAIGGPAELLALGGASEGATHALSHIVDGVTTRLHGVLHRATETLSAMPPNGRTAAAVAVAATAVAGGAATVEVSQPSGRDRTAVHRREQEQTLQTRALIRPGPTPSSSPLEAHPLTLAKAARNTRSKPASNRHARHSRVGKPAVVSSREPLGDFETQTKAQSISAQPSSPTTRSVASASSPSSRDEFGFERRQR